jgi:CRISPR system Cascade subunit CasB
MKKPFDKGQPASTVLRKWWESLEDNKGERAELCRCSTPTEVLLCPAFYNIAQPLEETGIVPVKRPAVAAIIGLLAGVRNDDPQLSVPKAMAQGDNKPTVSSLRFRRLLEAQTIDELYPLMRRVLGLLDKTVNLGDLAASVYDWDNETRKRWAYEYFVNAPKKTANS